MALRCLAIRIVIRGRLLTRGCSETAWQQQSALARNLRGLEPQEVCQAVARFGGAEALDFLNLLTALQRLVRRSPRRMPSEEEELARQLMRAMCQHLGSSDSRERHRARRLGWLAQGAWAAAKCRELPEAQALLQEVGLALRAVLERRKAPLEARDAAQLLWALASGRVALPGLSLAGRLRPQDFSPQDTANVLWALGRLEDEELFAELLPRAEAQVEQMEPQGLAAVLATLAQRRGDATVATAAAGLVQRAARRVQRDIEQTSRLQDSAWRVAELVQLCWAFSALQLEAAQFQHLALRLAREANSPSSSQAFAARDLSLLAWSFANSSSVPLALEVPRIAQAALPRLREFDNQGVANLCWALGSTGTADRAIFARLAHAEELDFTARQLANICWASATVAFLQRDIFEQADRLAQRRPRGVPSPGGGLAAVVLRPGLAAAHVAPGGPRHGAGGGQRMLVPGGLGPAPRGRAGAHREVDGGRCFGDPFGPVASRLPRLQVRSRRPRRRLPLRRSLAPAHGAGGARGGATQHQLQDPRGRVGGGEEDLPGRTHPG
ncbi:unnamed protein product [Effrenium voratum]|nr:unnamed protein product [Effrenium voratum]